MKYEFHVGDYVETKDGDIGVITKVDTGGLSYWYCTNGNGFRIETHTYIIPVGIDADMARVYNRIGQYDFTKPERFKKIKQLEMGKDNTWNERCGGWLCVHQNKINELVEAVNRLEEKVNEMA